MERNSILKSLGINPYVVVKKKQNQNKKQIKNKSNKR